MKVRLATTGLAVPCVAVVVTTSLSFPNLLSPLLPELIAPEDGAIELGRPGSVTDW